MSGLFPRTEVEGLSLSRMIIGTNWLAGWSHTSPSAKQRLSRNTLRRTCRKPPAMKIAETGVLSGISGSPTESMRRSRRRARA